MNVGEFVKICSSTLELLSKNDVRINDFRYISLFKEFEESVKHNKVSYVVAVLSKRYHLSEASVYRIIRRFKRTI